MCAEKVQRIIQAVILGLVMGLAGIGMFKTAFLIQFGMMVMLLIAGFTGYCPGLIVLKKIFPACKCEEDQ